MTYENMTTEQHAYQISESLLKGQHKQALSQFENALAEHCNSTSLLSDLTGLVGVLGTLVIATSYIAKLREPKE